MWITERTKTEIKKMNKKTLHGLMNFIFDEVTRTRNAGQQEYARDLDNVFANFERVASFISESKSLYSNILTRISLVISGILNSDLYKTDC